MKYKVSKLRHLEASMTPVHVNDTSTITAKTPKEALNIFLDRLNKNAKIDLNREITKVDHVSRANYSVEGISTKRKTTNYYSVVETQKINRMF